MEKIDPCIFGNFEPLEVFAYYDGPLIFIIKNNDGHIFYVHAADFGSDNYAYMVKNITENELQDLKECKITLRNLLVDSPYKANWSPIYLVKQYFEEGKLEAYIADPEELEPYLPQEGVFLERNR